MWHLTEPAAASARFVGLGTCLEPASKIVIDGSMPKKAKQDEEAAKAEKAKEHNKKIMKIVVVAVGGFLLAKYVFKVI